MSQQRLIPLPGGQLQGQEHGLTPPFALQNTPGFQPLSIDDSAL